MLKHAFLIIAHNEFTQLVELIKLLDDDCNDLYIHIDKKVKGFNKEQLSSVVKCSRISVSQEISVSWGDSSQMECELFLLKKASKSYHDYYHFLSGVDLPIKSMDEIHAFFEQNNGKEFIHFDSSPAPQEAMERVMYKHYFSKYLKKYSSKIVTKSLFIIDHFLVKVQKKMGFRRKLPYAEVQKGCNWCSITDGFVKKILMEQDIIRKMLEFSLCGDELFVQTVCINSEYKNNLYSKAFDNNYNSCLRLIIWDEKNKKKPHTFSEDDLQVLRNSECLFARKFSMVKYEEFTRNWIDEINKKNILNRQKNK